MSEIIISGQRQAGKTEVLVTLILANIGEEMLVITPTTQHHAIIRSRILRRYPQLSVLEYNKIKFATEKNLQTVTVGRAFDKVFMDEITEYIPVKASMIYKTRST